MDRTYAARVGERLRGIRLQKGLSLHDVEESSQKEFKASVLGAYERGERSISVPRLQRLAQFYGVPTDRLLPEPERLITLDQQPVSIDGGIRIDLTKLDGSDSMEGQVVGRYVKMIQMARGDYNGRVLTVRADDARALAAVLETTADGLASRLDELGLRIASVV
ncbi:MAG TPA: helix-turn-helix domain-containing protein [Actinomycetota bacterium]|nr:helix-turn-helix domain-containing protein [Actinomycetota bacterium]